MPMDTIDSQLTTMFQDIMLNKVQQSSSRLSPYVDIKPMSSDTLMIDTIGTIELKEIVGRNVPVTATDVDFSRRKLTPKYYGTTVFLDDADVKGMASDPEGPLARELEKAFFRELDRLIALAANATIYTGRSGDVAVTAATDGVLTVNATGGLTAVKLREINKNFIGNEVTADGMVKVALAISEDEHDALLGETTLTSGDYSRSYSLEAGQMQSAMGLELIKFGHAANTTSPIIPVISGTRQCFAFAEGAFTVGMFQNMKIEIGPRNDYYRTRQVKVEAAMGAVRNEGKRVQLVTTTDS